MRRFFLLLRVLCIAAATAVCMQSCDEVSGFEKGSEAVTWRESDTKNVSSAQSTFTFSFTAREAWQVVSDRTDMLTVISSASGTKGRGTVSCAVSENQTGSTRTAHLLITVEGYGSETLLTVVQTDSRHADYDVNAQKIDPLLAEYYLWNDEYKALKRTYEQPYDDFVEKTLLSMKTNGEDGNTYSDGSRYLYSYIVRTPASGASRSVLDKETEPTFGIVNVMAVTLVDSSGKDTGSRAFCLSGVYPGTPAANAGLKRGSWILEYDGKKLTQTSMYDAFAALVASPRAGESHKLTVVDEYSADAEQKTVTLTAADMSLNPVLYSDVIESDGMKIGYLVYANFEASFDDELLAEIRKFKSAGISDLVLDLRVNGGGHVISAQMLASIIAGQQGIGKDCLKYEYNPDRMKKMGYSKPDKMETLKFGPDAAPKDHISNYTTSDYLSLSRVYVLVTGSTASASELTFTSLRGIDFPVTLIGERTEGKNVGMEPQLFKYDGYDYQFYPITFRYFNAKNATCDPDGTKPDYEIDEWSAGRSSYRNWGSDGEPFLSKALELITGHSQASLTRSAEEPSFRGVPSGVTLRTGRGGLIAPTKEN